SGDREAVAHAFAECRKIRRNSIDLFCTGNVPAKAGNHFIENKHRAFAAAECLYRAKEVSFRLYGRCSFENDASNSAGVLFKERTQAFNIIVSELNGQVLHDLRNACRHGSASDEPVFDGKERLITASGNQIAASVGPR